MPKWQYYLIMAYKQSHVNSIVLDKMFCRNVVTCVNFFLVLHQVNFINLRNRRIDNLVLWGSVLAEIVTDVVNHTTHRKGVKPKQMEEY